MDYSYIRRRAREALNPHWGIAIGITLIAGILGGSLSNPDFNITVNLKDLNNDMFTKALEKIESIIPLPFLFTGLLAMTAFFSVISIAQLIIGGAIELGLCRFNLNLLDNNKPQLKDLFSQFNIFGDAFALKILTTLFTFLWTLLFIIPGIIASFSYAMAPYILLENPNIGALDAIRRSKVMMRGEKFNLFCLNLSFIGWFLLSCLSCGIGFLWLKPYVNAANAEFYNRVSGRSVHSYTAEFSEPMQ